MAKRFHIPVIHQVFSHSDTGMQQWYRTIRRLCTRVASVFWTVASTESIESGHKTSTEHQKSCSRVCQNSDEQCFYWNKSPLSGTMERILSRESQTTAIHCFWLKANAFQNSHHGQMVFSVYNKYHIKAANGCKLQRVNNVKQKNFWAWTCTATFSTSFEWAVVKLIASWKFVLGVQKELPFLCYFCIL